MNQSKCTFLGTGTSQGVPMIGCTCEVCVSSNAHDARLRSSILLSIGNKNIVVDTGPDFRQQMLRAKVNHLDAILITHEHNDHIAGLDDIRPFNFMQKKALDLFASSKVLVDIKTKFDYVFSADKYPGAPSINLHEIGESDLTVAGIEIVPIHYMHGSLPVIGFRYNEFAYLTDIKSIESSELKKLDGLSTLVISALHHQVHHSHFNLEEALQFISMVNPKRAYLTHISHRMGLAESVNELLPTHVSLAYDGLELSIA